MQVAHYTHEKHSPFGVAFNYYIATFDPLPKDYVSYLETFILSIEKEIVETFKYGSDGDTGLGNDSVTSKFLFYNLFKTQEFSFLKQHVKNSVYELLDYTGYGEYNVPLYGHCWCNVMRKGEQIKEHHHDDNMSKSFLSGHVPIKTNKTCTYYINPIDKSVDGEENIDGQLTLFPSYIRHYTSQVEDDIRVTVAFDIIPEFKFVNDNLLYLKKNHYVEL